MNDANKLFDTASATTGFQGDRDSGVSGLWPALQNVYEPNSCPQLPSSPVLPAGGHLHPSSKESGALAKRDANFLNVYRPRELP